MQRLDKRGNPKAKIIGFLKRSHRSAMIRRLPPKKGRDSGARSRN